MEKLMNNALELSDVLVFKTSLQTAIEVQFVSETLNSIDGIEGWSVDLEDWESILRIESSGITAEEVKKRTAKSRNPLC